MAESRNFFEDYLRYRFGAGESTERVAEHCGVTAQVIGDAPMSDQMRQTLDCFFTAQQQTASGTPRHGHSETSKPGHKGAHAA